ncbi:conserved phage C-terminal domain-containing protein [Verrucomicrobia bacterium]|jgi:uncharacterized phage protein (TIGR02220 family)|nr:conserved phage C-terminal domain-containing protein [Verrucomicrobiota bacterium]
MNTDLPYLHLPIVSLAPALQLLSEEEFFLYHWIVYLQWGRGKVTKNLLIRQCKWNKSEAEIDHMLNSISETVEGVQFDAESVEIQWVTESKERAMLRRKAASKNGKLKGKKPKLSRSSANAQLKRKRNSTSISPNAVDVISSLNNLTGKGFKPENKPELEARIDEHGVECVMDVIRYKHSRWGHLEGYRDNLCPGTLFKKSNFERYVEELPATDSTKTLRRNLAANCGDESLDPTKRPNEHP